MTKPFTYVLTHLPSQKRYYGVRYAYGCHPDDLFTKYFSSSKVIKELIKKDGISAFHTEIRKTFNTQEAALLWEQRVLEKLKVITNNNWLNKGISGKSRPTIESIAKANETKKRRYGHLSSVLKGRVLSEETRAKMSAARKRNPRSPNKGKKCSDAAKQAKSIKMTGKKKPIDFGDKIRNSRMGTKRLNLPDGTFTWIKTY